MASFTIYVAVIDKTINAHDLSTTLSRPWAGSQVLKERLGKEKFLVTMALCDDWLAGCQLRLILSAHGTIGHCKCLSSRMPVGVSTWDRGSCLGR